MVSLDWSAGNLKPNEVEAKNQPHLFVSARQLCNANRQVFVIRADEKFGIASSDHATLTSRQVKREIQMLTSSNFDLFDSYSDVRFKVKII